MGCPRWWCFLWWVDTSTGNNERVQVANRILHRTGKDWSKVDRSGAYAARWIAKSLLAAGLARRALVQLSYAIGVAEPLSIFVDSYGTGKGKTDAELVEIIRKNWDLRPGALGKLRFAMLYIRTLMFCLRE